MSDTLHTPSDSGRSAADWLFWATICLASVLVILKAGYLAVHGGWYGALGGNLNYIKSTGVDAATRTGLNLASGYRFQLTHDVGGRVEANYTMFPDNSTYGLPPTNTFGLMFGLTLPVK